ncbi:MAG: hypothetical protein J2P17_11295, partial [Mycobacterium sp.]|nr:hypothetical protein [Mycobacterium sp.]
RTGSLVTWWTGDAVMVFDAMNLTYQYSIAGAGTSVPLGPATMMAGKLLVPVRRAGLSRNGEFRARRGAAHEPGPVIIR